MEKFSLKKSRAENGMTQEELAAKVGVTRQHIGLIENGTANPSPAVAKAIGKVLKFDWTSFYDEEE